MSTRLVTVALRQVATKPGVAAGGPGNDVRCESDVFLHSSLSDFRSRNIERRQLSLYCKPGNGVRQHSWVFRSHLGITYRFRGAVGRPHTPYVVWMSFLPSFLVLLLAFQKLHKLDQLIARQVPTLSD